MKFAAANSSSTPTKFNNALLYTLSLVRGAVVEANLCTPQWFVPGRFVQRADYWIPANEAAWALGMPVIFMGASAVLPSGFTPITVLIMIFCLTAAGAVVGARRRLVLTPLLNQSIKGAK